MNQEQRFWNRVDKRGEDECWPWTGPTHKGYGRMRVGGRKVKRAHVVSYELHYGPLSGLFVLHRCDNPSCCNPKHLFSGTHQDNQADKVQKDRQAYGIRHGRAKLSPQKLEAAKVYRYNGWTYKKIAERFNVSKGAVHHALIGMTWKR